mmetsp:Transcript_71995/g.216435  ORF Transcript_71995/g.216435 Transcript_71995/m.216435 type:complete len:277 (+) Transcript_71995:1982-2812(+)
MEEVGAARRRVHAEDVRVAGLVVHAHHERQRRVGDRLDRADNVHGQPVDGRQEELEVGARDELGEHAARLLVDHAAQRRLLAVEPLRHLGQVPDGLDRRFGRRQRAVLHQDLLVGLEVAVVDGDLDLGQVEVRARHRDRRPDVDRAVLDAVAEDVLLHVTPRVERHNLLDVKPGFERADLLGRQRVGEVGTEVGRRVLHGQRHRPVHRVGARVRADRIPLARLRDGRDDRATLARVARAPLDGLRIDAKVGRVRRQLDQVARRRVQRHAAVLRWHC